MTFAKTGRLVLVAACVLLFTRPLAADPRADDGLYGRFDGDLDLSLGLGAALGPGGASGAARARAIYLQTAGAYASYLDALGASRPSSRSLGLGVTLRPLFLPRWALDLDHGPAFLDLTLDSVALDLGVFWAGAPVSGWQRAGLELGGGFEIPLFGEAPGLWLGFSAAKRWSSNELAASATTGAPSGGALAMFTVSWHAVLATHLVDAGDALRR